jgi:hypothetical protein
MSGPLVRITVEGAMHLARCRFDPKAAPEIARVLADEVDRLNAVLVRQGQATLANLGAATPVPSVAPEFASSTTCDWGDGCGDESAAQRWDPESGLWLPVCAVHEIAP